MGTEEVGSSGQKDWVVSRCLKVGETQMHERHELTVCSPLGLWLAVCVCGAHGSLVWPRSHWAWNRGREVDS